MEEQNEEFEQEEIENEPQEIVEIELEQPEEEILPPSSTSSQKLSSNLQSLSHHFGKNGTSNRIQDVINSHKTNQRSQQSQSTNNAQEDSSPLENVTEQVQNMANQVAGKAASAGLQAAGIPAPLAEAGGKLATQLLNKKTIPQKILDFLGFSKTITNNRILSNVVFYGAISTVGILLFLAIILSVSNSRSEQGKIPIASYLSTGMVDDDGVSQSLTEYMISGGWCDNAIDCFGTTAYQFYANFRSKIEDKTNELKDEIKKRQKLGECKDVGPQTFSEDITMLWIATMYYNRPEDELLSSELVDIIKFFQYMNEMDYLIDATVTTDSNSCPYVSTEFYQEAITGDNGYIDLYRSDLGINLSVDDKWNIYNAILEERDAYMGISNAGLQGIGGYAECSGVTVKDRNNHIIGTYSLEEYVAGVVTAEMYEDFPEESKKALAVAARTYVLSRTNSCQNAIESSSNLQNFSSTISSSARQATNATAGEVLVDALGNIFASEYDSWNCKGQNTCTYTKEPTGGTHQVTISNTYLSRAAGGHGRGMSQLAAADMANRGSSYQDILFYFYSDGVKIANLTQTSGLLSGAKFTSTAPIHNSVNDLWNNGFYNRNAANLGQCVWYARSRAQEILYYSNMPEELKTVAINSIKNTLGNGEAWYRNPDGSIFSKSTDVTKPRAGAIVSWSGGVTGCGSVRCGHVAIIESVNPDGTVTISEGWKTPGMWDSKSWSTVNYRKFTVGLDYVQYHTNNSGEPYYFNGYVYLLG